MLNFNHLYYFYMTVKSGTVTVAAEHLKISQPSLSSQLKVLEGTLNIKLFRKVGRNNQLTEDGLLIYSYCQKMFGVAEELVSSMSIRMSSTLRKITIGVSNEIERGFVGHFIDSFLRQNNPRQAPSIRVLPGTHEQLVDGLLFRELDLVLTQEPLVQPDLLGLMCVDVPVVLVVCKDRSKWLNEDSHPKVLAAETFFNAPDTRWILPALGTKLRAEIDSFFAAQHLSGRVVFESDAMASQLQSVTDGIGVAFIPISYLSKDACDHSLTVVGPVEGFWRHRVWLGCHAKSKLDHDIISLARAFSQINSSDGIVTDLICESGLSADFPSFDRNRLPQHQSEAYVEQPA